MPASQDVQRGRGGDKKKKSAGKKIRELKRRTHSFMGKSCCAKIEKLGTREQMTLIGSKFGGRNPRD